MSILNYKDLDTLFLDVVSKEDGHCTYNSIKYNEQVIQFDNKEYLYKIKKNPTANSPSLP